MRTSIYRPEPLQNRRDHKLRRPILLPRRPVNHPRRGHRTEEVLAEPMDCDTASTTRVVYPRYMVANTRLRDRQRLYGQEKRPNARHSSPRTAAQPSRNGGASSDDSVTSGLVAEKRNQFPGRMPVRSTSTAISVLSPSSNLHVGDTVPARFTAIHFQEVGIIDEAGDLHSRLIRC